jgi:hypothetical protein
MKVFLSLYIIYDIRIYEDVHTGLVASGNLFICYVAAARQVVPMSSHGSQEQW